MLGILFQCKCAYEMFLKGGVELECYVVLAQPLLCCRLHWYEAGAAAAAVVKPSDWDNQIWALIGPSTEERAGTSEGEKRRWTWLKRTSVDLSTGDRGMWADGDGDDRRAVADHTGAHLQGGKADQLHGQREHLWRTMWRLWPAEGILGNPASGGAAGPGQKRTENLTIEKREWKGMR